MTFRAANAVDNQADTICDMQISGWQNALAYHDKLAARRAEYENERKDMLAAQGDRMHALMVEFDPDAQSDARRT